MMLALLAQLLNSVANVAVLDLTVITGTIGTLYAVIGVWGAMQLAGTPSGIME
jgi:hypothetical protein